jgi:enoyl-CoA hydratase
MAPPAGPGAAPGTDPELDVRTEEGVLRLTMNRPDRLNAMTDSMSDALAAQLEGAAGRDDVRVVLLAGAGGAFSAGADVAGTDAHERFDVRALDRANRLVRAIVALDRPVIAAVRGVAAGVGCSMAVACDLVVAAESASFLLAFARIGLMPDGGATATVAASIGRSRAMRMALLAEPLPARAAYDAGLVSHVVPDAEHEAAVREVVARLVAGPPLSHSASKKAVNAATLAQLGPALDRERTGQSTLLRTADAAEGMRAFTEKRAPRFTGT